MNNLGIIKSLIEQLNSKLSDSYQLSIALIIFIGINLLTTGITIYFQFKLKNKEKEISSYNMIEKKRIEIQEQLYNMLEKLTYYDGSLADKSEFQNEISAIIKYLTQRRLFLTKEIIKISQEFADYNSSILMDYRKKDYKKEMYLLEEYNKKFNGRI